MMGSGGMVIMDEDSCMVDVAKFFLTFTNDESCGKCTSCRDGSEALLEILTRISEGEGKEGDLIFLEELSTAIKDASLCGLGQTLPNPVLSTLRYFREEYEAHINSKMCPAKVCKALIGYYIDENKCTGCQICFKYCTAEAISGELKAAHSIDESKCTNCGTCFDVCPPKINAVMKYTGEKP
jgi:ferredoxin